MPDLGRWNGIDQLAESYLSTSPYAYVANNPVSQFDVDGRWFNEDGSIRPSTTFDYMPGAYKPTMSFSTSNGMHYNEGGGSYTPFGKTQAYVDLMTAFLNGKTGGISNIGGTLRWWTDYEDPDPTVTGIGAFGMLKLKGSSTTDWYGPAGKGNWFLGLGGSVSLLKGHLNSERMYTQGIRRGITSNYVLKGRNLSLFGKMPATDGSLPIAKMTKIGNAIGKYSFF